MRYRVDELASRCELSVDTVRFYQSKGLLSAPERQGRVAWYSDEHLDRLERIKDLKSKGLTLAAIKRLVGDDVDTADEALLEALAQPAPGETEGESWLTLDDLAERTGVSPALLRAVEREGLLVPHERDGRSYYSGADVEVVGAGLALLESGLPLGELLDLARRHDSAMREIAAHAVELFIRFVRDPVRATASSQEEAAGRLVEAFRTMLPATSSLVSSHFRRVLMEVAWERIERDGSEDEIAAVRGDGGRET